MWSLFSRERTLTSMMDGMAGLTGLVLSLARLPPRLPRFLVLSHRFRHLLITVAPAGGPRFSKARSQSISIKAKLITLYVRLHVFLMSNEVQRSYTSLSILPAQVWFQINTQHISCDEATCCSTYTQIAR